MRFVDQLASILATLNAQRVRTLLTLLGIILGVGTLVLLSSAIEGMGKYMQHGLRAATGEDIVTVSRRWKDEKSGKTAQPLDRFDSRALSQAPSLMGARVLNTYTQRVPYGTREGQQIQAVGTTPEALDFYELAVAKGRFITQADVWSRERVAVLGAEAVSNLIDSGDPLGQEIKLKGVRFKVVGVLAPKPTLGQGGFWTWNKAVIVNEPAYVDRLSETKGIEDIVLRAPSEALETLGLARLAHTAKAVVLNRHRGVENFHVTDPLKDAQSVKIAGMLVGALEGAIALVCLGVGGINIMNIMLVTVTQRTREIGIHRALGATKADIRRQFLVEAAILAAVGGVLGVAGGTLLAWLLSLILTATLGYWPFVFPPLQAALGFAFSLLTGLAFGWYPAHRAANLSPIDCLRYE
ncbi:Macrolide export ATP-binding/permease protein MacB [compost metagenome]